MSAEPAPSWIEAEPDLKSGPIRELRRLGRRARTRPVRTLGITLLLSLAMVAWRVHRPRTYPARVVLRVTEDNVDSAVQPPLQRQLRQYVADVVFSTTRLWKVLKTLEPGRDLEAARDNLEVEVYRNEFVAAREADQPPRSARIAIGYRSRDPQVAAEVVRRLGQLVADEETRVRTEQVAALEQAYAHAAADAQAALDACRQDIAKTELALAAPALTGTDRAGLQVELVELKRQEEALQWRLSEADQRKAVVDLRAHLESQRLGLRFEVVDLTPPARVTLVERFELVLIGLIAFTLLLPLVVVAVGALDDRVYDLEDVRRLGLEPAGHVPGFPGDDIGSLDARPDAARGIT